MGYKVVRNKKIVETLELGDNIKLEVVANVGLIANDFNAVYNKILKLQKEGVNVKNASSLGEAVIDLFSLTLGEENTVVLLEYFDNNFIEMLEQMVPFIEETFIPEIKRMTEEKRKAASINYKNSQRRKFGKK